MFKKLIFFILFILTSFYLTAQPEGFIKVVDTNFIMQKLEEVSSKTNSINAEFIQEKNLTFLSEKIISNGTMLYEKPEKLKLEYIYPFSYILIINSGELLIKSDDTETKLNLESSKMFNEINDLIINSVQGKILDNKEWKTVFFENDISYFVRMMPYSKELLKYIKTIELLIGKNDYTVSEFKVTEQSDDYTLIKFVNKKINEDIPDSNFYID